MKIKEVCALTGLTERTVRFYVEKGLCTPRVTMQNGRQFREYTAADVDALRTVATLRRMCFSLEEIARMQQHPQQIPAVLDEYRARIAEEAEVRAEILAMDADALARCASVTQLAQQMRAAADRRKLPPTDVMPDFGKLDGDGPHHPDAELQGFWARADAKVQRGQRILWIVAGLNVLLELLVWILGASNFFRFLVAVALSAALAMGKRWARVLFLIGAGVSALAMLYVLAVAIPSELTGAVRTAAAVASGAIIAYDAANFVVLLKSPAVAAYLEDRESA